MTPSERVARAIAKFLESSEKKPRVYRPKRKPTVKKPPKLI